MDIKFKCSKCDQHLVIDEAGAGLTIQCPRCSAPLTVPTPPALSSPLVTASFAELRNRCRNLIYESRVEDAIALWKEAEKARAREKGYPLNEAFCFNDTATRMIERGKWAIAQTLNNLTPREEREILGALIWQELSGGSHGSGCDEMRAVVIGSNLRWPSFEEWFRKFKIAREWPFMWGIWDDEDEESDSSLIEIYEKELTQPTDPVLAQLHELSLAARRLVFGQRSAPTLDFVREAGIELEAVISELRGVASRLDPSLLDQRLQSIPLKLVQSLQKKFGVTVPRAKKGESAKGVVERRRRIIQPLLATVGTDQLAAGMPQEVLFYVLRPDSPRADFERFRADLLAHTLSAKMATYRDYMNLVALNRNARHRTGRLRMTALLSNNEDCSFCVEACKKLEAAAKVNLEMLPPFHPGCRCCTVTVSER